MDSYLPVLDQDGQVHPGPCNNPKCCTGPDQVMRRNIRKAGVSRLEKFIRHLRGECEGMIGNATLERLVERLHFAGITYDSLQEYVRGTKRGSRSFTKAQARDLHHRIGRNVISQDFLYVILERYQNAGDYQFVVKKEEPSFDPQPNVVPLDTCPASVSVEEGNTAPVVDEVTNATAEEDNGFAAEQAEEEAQTAVLEAAKKVEEAAAEENMQTAEVTTATAEVPIEEKVDSIAKKKRKAEDTEESVSEEASTEEPPKKKKKKNKEKEVEIAAAETPLNTTAESETPKKTEKSKVAEDEVEANGDVSLEKVDSIAASGEDEKRAASPDEEGAEEPPAKRPKVSSVAEEALRKIDEEAQFSDKVTLEEDCFTCTLCDYKVSTSDALKTHIGEIHLDQELEIQLSNLFPSNDQNKCARCDETIAIKYVQKEHIIAHHPWEHLLQLALGNAEPESSGKSDSCDELQAPSQLKPDLLTKLKLNQQANDKVEKLLARNKASTGKVQCAHCDSVLKDLSALRKHIAKHADDLLYYCLHCDNIYKTNNTLKYHMSNKHRDVPSKVAGPAPSASPPAASPPAGPVTLISTELASYLCTHGIEDCLLKYNVTGISKYSIFVKILI